MEFAREGSEEEDEFYERYIAIPKRQDCFHEEGKWTKRLSSGKVATILYTIVSSYGICIVDITDKERKKIIKSEKVRLTDYDCELRESHPESIGSVSLKDSSSFSRNELEEILLSICKNDDNNHNNVDVLSADIDICDIEYMQEEGGWNLDETYYYIYDGCVLIPEGEDIDDYLQKDGTYANLEMENEENNVQ